MHLTGPLLIAPIMLPFLLAIQLYALNRSLDLAPPLLSVPLFFAGFTGPQLPDQIVMNLVATGQSGYEAWELGVLGVGVAVVLLGVGVLAGGGAKDDPVRLD